MLRRSCALLVLVGLSDGCGGAPNPVQPVVDVNFQEAGPTPAKGRFVAEDGEAELPQATPSTETYDDVADNPFRAVAQQPLSTFSVDVDTASYANIRRFLSAGQRPPRAAVRIEEL